MLKKKEQNKLSWLNGYGQSKWTKNICSEEKERIRKELVIWRRYILLMIKLILHQIKSMKAKDNIEPDPFSEL